MTQLTLTNENGTYTVSIPDEDLTLDVIFDRLLEPVLRAAGYSQVSIDGLLVK